MNLLDMTQTVSYISALLRCGAGIQNWKPEQPRGRLPHHARLEQPLPSEQSPHVTPLVRTSL